MTQYTSAPIRIATLSDITLRPKYQSAVPPRRSLFRFVLASYSFPRKIASCAVSDCFQNHKKGYLVALADGGECSICVACAERFLDAAARRPPKTVRSSPSRAGDRGEARERSTPVVSAATRTLSYETFVAESECIKVRLKALKQDPQGGNWLFQSLTQFYKHYPAELFDALRQLQQDAPREALFELLIERNGSDQQLQDLEQLEGLAVLDGDIRELLVERIHKPLLKLDEKAARSGAGGTLTVPLAWSDEVEQAFTAAEQLIDAGRAFFSDTNLQRLRSIPLDEKAAATVRSLRWDCSKGAPA